MMDTTNLPTIGGIKELSPLEAELLNQPKPDKSLFDRIADFYYAPKCFELHGRLYEWLGVRYFKEKIMQRRRKRPDSLLEKEQGSNYFVGQANRDVKALTKFEHLTRYNERVHALVEVSEGGLFVSQLAVGNYLCAGIIASFIVGNGYLVMVQRYNRNRVENTIKVLKDQYQKNHSLGVE